VTGAGDVASGSLVVAAAISVAAGAVSFASPCVLPLVPGYLAFVSGLSGADLADRHEDGGPARGVVVAGAGLFVLGFAIFFTLIGGAFGALGQALAAQRRLLGRLGGILVATLGLFLLGIWRPQRLERERRALGLVRAGQTRAYPQLVLVWHEIVNDHLPDGPLSVTYCPLTGSVLGFRGTTPRGEPYTFGTSGDLVNSNPPMYDRQTDSRWPQLLGQAILGPGRGRALQEVPWSGPGGGAGGQPTPTPWCLLSTRTGSLRNYGTDPYGSYNYGPAHELFGYYRPGLGRYLYFPLLHESDRFDEKEVMVGAKLDAQRLAVRKSLLRGRLAVNATMGRRPVAFLYDPALDVGRAFLATPQGGPQAAPLRLAPTATPGRYTDDDTGSTWDSLGQALQGRRRGTALRQVLTFDVLWLAWHAFFPQAEVLG
jgi:cytochrome c biogenesis protein CcdA